MNNISSYKSHFDCITYLSFYTNMNKLVFGNTELWSMLNLLAFTSAILNIANFLIIASSKFAYNNKSFIINEFLSLNSLCNSVIKQICIIKKIEN